MNKLASCIDFKARRLCSFSHGFHALGRKLSQICLAGVLFLGCVQTAHAAGEGLDVMGGLPLWPSPDIIGLRPLGMGGAGIAMADGSEALYINPAGLARRKRNSVLEGAFYFHPGADNRVFNIGIAENETNPILGAGASYSYYTSPREDDGKTTNITGHIARLAVAIRSQNKFFVGVTLKYMYMERPFLPIMESVNGDVGFTWQFHRLFSVSATGYNLIYKGNREEPIAAALGLSYGYQQPLQIAVDWVMDFESKGELGHEVRVGAEYTFREVFTLRLGYHLDLVRDRNPPNPLLEAEESSGMHFLTAGIGFRYANFGAEIAYRQQLATGKASENRYLAFSVKIFPRLGGGRRR